ncbi:MAG: hypothetical protein L0H15_09500 [Nitrosospira sp.]|nr:hypothetical protein [Nitrosospira sp.]MDN5882395.1 hypothetical protein [Nitrosospira sp.]
MKTIRFFGTRGLILATVLGVSISVGFASPAFAQAVRSGAVIVNPDGKVTYLGTLGGSYTYARGINDSGQVVGWSDTTGGDPHAFITGPDGMGMTDLGTLGGSYSSAYDINDSGQVTGRSRTTGNVMYLTTPS